MSTILSLLQSMHQRVEMADGTLFGGQGNTFSSRCAVQDKNALWWFEQGWFCWLRTIMNTRINLLREGVLKAK